MNNQAQHRPTNRFHQRPPKRTVMFLWPFALALCFLGAFTAGPVLAASPPAWSIAADATPTNFLPYSTGEEEPGATQNRIELNARNLGDTTIYGSSATPIIVSVHLQGATAVETEGVVIERTVDGTDGSLHNSLSSRGIEMQCQQLVCTYEGAVAPGEVVSLLVTVATGAPGTVVDTATVSGGTDADGEALSPATVAQQLPVSATPASFGIQPSSLVAEFVEPDGAPETQAGAHPYDLSLSWAFDNDIKTIRRPIIEPVEEAKDVAVELPPGVVGNELAVGQCTSVLLAIAKCSGASQVGTLHVGAAGGLGYTPWALFNMQPDNGHTNELGISADGQGTPVHLVTSVRTGGDYGLTATTHDIPNGVGTILGITTQVWGVPAEAGHDWQRVLSGWQAVEPAQGSTPEEQAESGGHASPLPPTPFLTMPTQCGKPLAIKIAMDSWVHPGSLEPDGSPDLSDPNWKVSTVTDPPMTGCEKLQSFKPHVTVAPDTTYSDTPAGTTVEVSVPQGEGLTSASALATSTLQNTKVTLPQGMVINPGQANGLGACQFSEDGVGTTGPPSCPADSKVGTVEIETPLLPDKLEGSAYVMQSNPPNLQLLVAASADDVNVKLLGNVSLNTATGQLTTTFSGTPQLPVTHFRLVFSGGAQAALTTPPSCGVYSTTADFAPWSSPETPDFLSADAFGLDAGPGGSGCASPLPFEPSLIAGATTDQAGGYTGFSMLLQHADGQQRLAALQVKLPAGLSGMLSTVPLCEEPQAAAGTCPAVSQIGHAVVAAGAGPDPLYVPEPGRPAAPIYLTGSYRGAPFGLAIVVPVVIGPFDLGTVVVRAAISIDPSTAQITVTTDPLPQILDGVPTDLREIDAVIDRPGFMFNPTNCAPQEFAGVAQSIEGAQARISSHFQMGSCRSLLFKPDLKVSTSGRTSRVRGASLDVRIAYPSTPLGANQAASQANIAGVDVALPSQLPSRLTTLQKACASAQFEADPAGCPAGSVIGHAVVRTPELSVPLEGPAIFVSHGGEAFPSLTMVLQGEGVRIDLVGETFIKDGITSAAFKTIPDAPFSSFQLYLPEGSYSALTTSTSLCKSKLAMPTTFTAQNGAVIHESTPITVTGCAKTKPRKKASAKTTHAGKADARRADAMRAGARRVAGEAGRDADGEGRRN